MFFQIWRQKTGSVPGDLPVILRSTMPAQTAQDSLRICQPQTEAATKTKFDFVLQIFRPTLSTP